MPDPRPGYWLYRCDACGMQLWFNHGLQARCFERAHHGRLMQLVQHFPAVLQEETSWGLMVGDRILAKGGFDSPRTAREHAELVPLDGVSPSLRGSWKVVRVRVLVEEGPNDDERRAQ